MNRRLSRRTLLASLGGLALAGGGAAFLLTGTSTDAKAAGVVYKSPTCGCCAKWVDHMAAAGLPLDVENVSDLGQVKQDHGIPYGLSSCHTAVIDGYVVEGHVPADVVRRLLDERPDLAGLAVPGMPIGSPGMEGPSPEAYTVFGLRRGGQPVAYARIQP